MEDSIELTLDYPIPDADWDKIMDVEFENTKSITFRTKSGKTVEFAKVSEEFEWCTGCKEYDAERHCCPRWNKVIRNTVEELKLEKPICEYCHEDSDGYVKPIEKNGHAFVRFGMDGWELDLKANGWRGSAKIRYCPMCGRDLLVK